MYVITIDSYVISAPPMADITTALPKRGVGTAGGTSAGGLPMFVFIVIGAGVLLLLIVIVVFVLWRRKSQQKTKYRNGSAVSFKS